MKHLIPILLIFLCCSCGNAYYMAKAPTVPLLQEKGDMAVSGNLQISPILFTGAANLDASYAVTDHLAVQAMGQICDGKEDYYMHAAVGYFLPIREHQEFEAWAGAGKGLSIAGKEETAGNAHTTHFVSQQYFAMLNYGFHDLTRAHIDLGIGLRGGVMPFHLTSVHHSTGVAEVDQDYAPFFFEPQFFFRIGSEHVKFQLQVLYTTINSYITQNSIPNLLASPVHANVGITVMFGKRK